MSQRWPKRYVMIALLLAAMLLCYIDRIIISLATIEMQAEFGWSDSQKGLVLSVFFFGYLLTQAAGGFLSNKYGGRNVFLVAVLLWSLFTIATPFAAYTSFGVLIAVRILLGVGEGAAFPSAYNLIHRWMPLAERSRSVGGLSAAAAVGTVATLLTAGLLIEAFGWPFVFYLFGSLGVVWAITWAMRIPPMPAIEDDEYDAGHDAEPKPVPWRLLLTHRAIWTIYIASMCVGSISFTLASWLPSYFVDSFELTLTQAGLYSTLPWITVAFSTVLGGAYADRHIRAAAQRVAVRKRVTGFGLVLIVTSCLALTLVPNAMIAVAVICVLFAGQGIAVVGYAPSAAELLPEHGDIFYGIAAAAGSIGAMVVVSATGFLVENTNSYDSLFVGLAAICAITAFIYQAFARADALTEAKE